MTELTEEEKLALAKFRNEKSQIVQGNKLVEGSATNTENVSTVPINKDIVSNIRAAAKQAKSRKGFVIIPNVGGLAAKHVNKLIENGISPVDIFYGEEEVNQ